MPEHLRQSRLKYVGTQSLASNTSSLHKALYEHSTLLR